MVSLRQRLSRVAVFAGLPLLVGCTPHTPQNSPRATSEIPTSAALGTPSPRPLAAGTTPGAIVAEPPAAAKEDDDEESDVPTLPDRRSELVLEKQLQRQKFGADGSLVFGASACTDELRGLLVRIERPGSATLQADLETFVPCRTKRDGEGWSDPSDGGSSYVKLKTLQISPNAMLIVLDHFGGFEHVTHDERVLLWTPSELRWAWIHRGGFWLQQHSLVDLPGGQVFHVTSVSGELMGPDPVADSYEVTEMVLDPRGFLFEAVYSASFARVSEHSSLQEALSARTRLSASCGRLGAGAQVLAASHDDRERYVVGIAEITELDAQARATQLAKCAGTPVVVELLAGE